MEAEIGDAAGAIWRYLDKHGVTTLSRLRQQVKLPELILLMGIGWLAREGKLNLIRKGKVVKLNLTERQRESCLTRPHASKLKHRKCHRSISRRRGRARPSYGAANPVPIPVTEPHTPPSTAPTS
jgi:hypothetical protein